MVTHNELRQVRTFVGSKDIDKNENPLSRIVLVVSPVGSDDFVRKHLLQKAQKEDQFLALVGMLQNAHISCANHRAYLSVVLFTHIFGAIPNAQKIGTARYFDDKQANWMSERFFFPSAFNFAALRQAHLPLRL